MYWTSVVGFLFCRNALSIDGDIEWSLEAQGHHSVLSWIKPWSFTLCKCSTGGISHYGGHLLSYLLRIHLMAVVMQTGQGANRGLSTRVQLGICARLFKILSDCGGRKKNCITRLTSGFYRWQWRRHGFQFFPLLASWRPCSDLSTLSWSRSNRGCSDVWPGGERETRTCSWHYTWTAAELMRLQDPLKTQALLEIDLEYVPCIESRGAKCEICPIRRPAYSGRITSA